MGGNSTEDKVFCLSIAEAGSLFEDDDSRICVPTPYALSKGCWKSSDNVIDGRGCCYWWLRSPGCNQIIAAIVFTFGSLNLVGLGVLSDSNAVRPALWVNL